MSVVLLNCYFLFSLFNKYECSGGISSILKGAAYFTFIFSLRFDTQENTLLRGSKMKWSGWGLI